MKTLYVILFVLCPGILLILPSALLAESLSRSLEQRASQSAAKLPAPTRAVMEAARQELANSPILANAPAVGDTLPDATFIRATGETTTLYKTISNAPAVIIFYRGGWCPYCTIQLAAYQQHLKEIERLGARLVAITPELPDSALTTSQKQALQFSVLSDLNNTYAAKIGIVFTLDPALQSVYKEFGIDLEQSQGNGDWALPLAATFVIDETHKIRYAFLHTDYRKRADPETVLAELNHITAKP